MENQSRSTNKRNAVLVLISLVAIASGLIAFFQIKESGSSSREVDSIVNDGPLDFRKDIDEQKLQLKQNQAQMEQTRQKQESALQLLKSGAESEVGAKLGEQDRQKLSALTEILSKKNDNDPRLDKELRGLSPELKAKIREAYLQFPAESRNERGLLSFLIARELNSAEDAEFIEKVLSEEPCLSMANCRDRNSEPDPHLSSADQVSLDYPQLAALYQIQKQIESRPELLRDNSYRDWVMSIIDKALNNPSPRIQAQARKLERSMVSH